MNLIINGFIPNGYDVKADNLYYDCFIIPNFEAAQAIYNELQCKIIEFTLDPVNPIYGIPIYDCNENNTPPELLTTIQSYPIQDMESYFELVNYEFDLTLHLPFYYGIQGDPNGN